MSKVSIGLRGWRFDEAEVFDEEGRFRPMGEMSSDVRNRVTRLSALVGSPCDACWLIHGDENVQQCNVAAVVYGEPMAEVVLCPDHEDDFFYWYREDGGEQFRGTEAFQDEFHEWFADGGRAPKDYRGIEHVETNPDELPDPPEPDQEAQNVEIPEEERHEIDLRDVDLGQDYPT